MRKVIKVGDRFGRLTVVEKSGYHLFPSGGKNILWKCICDCGNSKIIMANSLRCNSGSCGCLHIESVRKTGLKNRKHRKGTEYLQNIHNLMMQRCYNKNDKKYNDYGGRGITVCARWNTKKNKNGVANFISDMGHRPEDKNVIDRINNSLGYSKENCRWVDYKESNLNRRPFKKNKDGVF